MFEQILNAMILGALLEDPELRELLESESDCSTCEDLECPMSKAFKEAEQAKVDAEFEASKEKIRIVKAMIAQIVETKMFWKSNDTFIPQVVLNDRGAHIKIKMPPANNDWSQHTLSWMASFIQTFQITWYSFEPSHEPGYMYIMVPNSTIHKNRNLK